MSSTRTGKKHASLTRKEDKYVSSTRKGEEHVQYVQYEKERSMRLQYKNRYAVAYMASTGSKTKNVNDVRFIFTFPTFEWGRLKYLGKYLPAL